MSSDAGPAGLFQETNERLRTGLERCRTLVSECRVALSEGTAEPSIFAWSNEPASADADGDKGLDPNRHSRD